MKPGWRERDLSRGGVPGFRPASIRAVVRHTRLALRAARLGESALLGSAALLLTRAAGALGPGGGAAGELWLLVLLAAALAALSWWLEHPVVEPRLARILDARLRYQGALLTGYELEARGGARSPLEELLCARVLERLRPGEALQALLPPLWVPLAAPLVAALVLALALERTRAAPAREQADLGQLVAGLQGTLSPGELAARNALEEGSLAAGELRELRELFERAGELARQAQSGEGQAAELRELERRCALQAAQLPRGGEVRAQLEELRVWLDALAQAAERPERQPAEVAGGGATAAPGPGSGASGAGGRSVHDPGPDARRLPVGGPTGEGPAGPPGAPGSSWWPAEYDGVVRRWVELRRSELGADSR
jgi:hypothetical protein